MGLISSALILFGLTIKWYFLLDDNTASLGNVVTWCIIIGSVILFVIGAMFIVGLHWYVEKKYNNNVQVNSDEVEKTQKHLREEHRNQSKRYKDKSSWLKWKSKKDPGDVENQSSIVNSIKPNSTTIYNTNATESSFQIISNDSYLSDTTSTATSASFSSTKKLVRTNSKFNQPSLPIIDETKQQSANDSYAIKVANNQPNSLQVAYVTNGCQQTDVIFDTKPSTEATTSKSNKTKHAHKLSTGSGKNYILEAFLSTQDLAEGTKLSDQMINQSIGNQVLSQLSNQSSISSQNNNLTNANGTLNDALDLTE